MIKTLRITSVLAVALAVAVFVLPIVSGSGSGKENSSFLDQAPDAIEAFKKAEGKKKVKDESQVPLLVKEAQAFALYLNPPPKKEPRKKAGSSRKKKGSPKRPKAVSAKFELIATSVYAFQPELSLALIDQPGKGLRWVKQSGKIGHLTIKQVKDGLVVVKDGQRTFEVMVERPEKKNLVKRIFPAGTPVEALLSNPKQTARDAEEIFNLLEAEEAEIDRNEDGLPAVDEDVPLEEFIRNLRETTISREEAERLDSLGKELKKLQRDPNRPKPKRRRPARKK